jgi:hyaluronoglucosaminidase
VNDALVMNELFLGPYVGREAGVAQGLDGILINPMLQAEATKIPLWTIGRFFRDGSSYNPVAAWDEALERSANGAGTEVIRLIAQQFQSHPFIGEAGESPELAAAVDAFRQSPTPQNEATLRALFLSFSTVRSRLDTDVGNRTLAAELQEPATKLGIYGEAGVLALDLLAERRGGGRVDGTTLFNKLDRARAIRWLVGGNTAVPAPLAALIANRAGRPADVFGDFFARVTVELGL